MSALLACGHVTNTCAPPPWGPIHHGCDTCRTVQKVVGNPDDAWHEGDLTPARNEILLWLDTLTHAYPDNDGDWNNHPATKYATPQRIRRTVRERIRPTDGLCTYCRKPLPPDWQIDHVIPKSRGGSHKLTNLRAACPDCNRAKGARTPTEWFADEGRPE